MRGQLACLFRTILPADAQEYQPGAFRARNPACPANGASPRDYQIASRYLRSGHVDGAVLSMHGKRPLDLHSLGVPVVLAARPFGNDEDLSYVDADNVGGVRMAVQYLLSHGRGTVATVAGPPDMSPGVDRLRGYRLTMAEAGLSDSGLIVFGDFGRVSA